MQLASTEIARAVASTEIARAAASTEIAGVAASTDCTPHNMLFNANKCWGNTGYFTNYLCRYICIIAALDIQLDLSCVSTIFTNNMIQLFLKCLGCDW